MTTTATYPQTEALLRTEAARYRNVQAINRLMNAWWKDNPDTYMEFWSSGVTGEAMLQDLRLYYPDYAARLFAAHNIYLARKFQVTYRMMKKPVRPYRR